FSPAASPPGSPMPSIKKMDLVRNDYYEEEIRYQTQLDRMNQTTAIREHVGIAYEPASQTITIRLPSTRALKAITGTVHLYRPSNASRDRTVPLAVDSQGQQQIDASRLDPGLWKVRIRWKADEHEYLVDQSLIVSTPNLAAGSPSPPQEERAGERR